MKPNLSKLAARFTLTTLALLLAALPLHAQEGEDDAPPVFQRTYEFRVLEHDAAEAMAWEA
jgi:hypothetical protein